uniref:CD44 antigen n=1 Tax=Varanus komodoensis TaxID=61221 RepID=A0A8D2L5U9_VARKO
MAKFWLCAALGFYLLQLCSAQIGLNISCRYGGVFHVEKNRRYSLTRDEAVELCRALNSTIPTWEQMQRAYNIGLETCRYGYIEDKVVLPRHTPYHLCAANTTGIYILMSNISDRYDTFCFNASEQSDMNCDPVVKLYSVWPNNGSHGMETIEIFNTDGSRFLDGKRVTEQPPVTDDDSSVGSGSANDRITTDPTIIRHGISQYPYPPDDVTRKYHIDDYDPDDKHPEDKHPETTSPDSHKNGNRGAVSDNDSPVPGEPPKSQPRRAHIPDWLIVVASLLALSLILGVCIAVNSRRRCGQKKKLVINNGKGGIEEKNMGGLNGEASKSHEMVHLVHNEKQGDHTGPHDEFLAIDETQNQQDVALKSGM